jgi:flagellar basal body-associated protein FliL
MGRFFDVLNTPIAVLVVLVAVVGMNAFLYFGQRPSEAPAERGEPHTPTAEKTERRAGDGEATQPATTLLSTTPTGLTATSSATASATSSP